MKLTDYFLAQLEMEAPRQRSAIAAVPDGQDDWKPHDKSMPFGRLAMLVAGMPDWIALIINGNELDLAPKDGGRSYQPPPFGTREQRMKAVEDAIAKGRQAIAGTTDEHLMKPWKLLVSGNVVQEQPRHIVLRDTFMHLAHHRGQLTVYLRLIGEPVPALYGPSADDQRFA